jgi:kynurenine formamidase
MTGRGVLLDFADWAESNSVSISALESQAITLESIKQVVKDHQLQFRKGDILFIRSGFTAAYNKLDDQQRRDMPNRPAPDFIGVEATEGMVRWLWEHQFAAVAGDAPSFERAPIRSSHADPNFNLHEWVLAGWGTPIGEMFDLEKLSQHCKVTGRYSFFLSSMPLKVCCFHLQENRSSIELTQIFWIGDWWSGQSTKCFCYFLVEGLPGERLCSLHR